MKWIFAPAIVLLFPVAALAAQVSAPAQDQGWLIAAHQTNLAEINSGKLAAATGHTDAVREAGRMLEAAHKSLDAKLKPLARQLGVKLPSRPNATQRAAMQRFHGESGMQFDKTWTHVETEGHVAAIAQTEREIKHGSLPQVRKLAQSALPVLKKHLGVLRRVAAEITGS